MKTALVAGGGGFIGTHLVNRLKADGYRVTAIDLKFPEFSVTQADEFVVGDLREKEVIDQVLARQSFDLAFQMAANMGGAEFVFSGDFDADILHNSSLINLHVCKSLVENKFSGIVYFASSACIYPQEIQSKNISPALREDMAYPLNPDSDYGYEKAISERLYQAFNRNYGLNIRIGRFHNVFGPLGTWQGNRAKAPAAVCRKVVEATEEIEIFGDGEQTRSFLFVDEAVEAVLRLMHSAYIHPLNIGSNELISINDLAAMAMSFRGKQLRIRHIDGPIGVRGRNSDNTLIKSVLGWAPSQSLRTGMGKTYEWIEQQVEAMEGDS